MKSITLLFPGAGTDEFTGDTQELISSTLRRLRPEEKGISHELFPSDSNLFQTWDKFMREKHMIETMKNAKLFIKQSIKQHQKKESSKLNIILIGQSIGGSYCDRLTNIIDEDEALRPFVSVKSIVLDPATKHFLRFRPRPQQAATQIVKLGKCVVESYRFYSTHDYFIQSYIPQCEAHTKLHIISLPVDHTEITGVSFNGGTLFRGSFLQSSGANNIAFAKPVSGKPKEIRDSLEKFIVLLLQENGVDLMKDKHGKSIKISDSSRIKRMRYKKNLNKKTRTDKRKLEENIQHIFKKPLAFRVEDVKEDAKIELVNEHAHDALQLLKVKYIAESAVSGIKRIWDFSAGPLPDIDDAGSYQPQLVNLAQRDLTEFVGVGIAEEFLEGATALRKSDVTNPVVERPTVNVQP